MAEIPLENLVQDPVVTGGAIRSLAGARCRFVTHHLLAFLGMFFCVLYYGAARDIILAFDDEPAVVDAGEWFLKLIALSFLFSGPMLPLGSAMNGAGDTKPPMIAAFLANWPVKLPLCYALALPFATTMIEHWIDLPLLLGLGGIWLGTFLWLLDRRPLVLHHDRNWPQALHLQELTVHEAAREEGLHHA